MKIFLIIAIYLSLSACGTMKSEQLSSHEIPKDQRINGYVHLDETCGTSISISFENKTAALYPQNLDPKFCVEGMRLKFFFHQSGTSKRKSCVFGFDGTVSEVTPLR